MTSLVSVLGPGGSRSWVESPLKQGREPVPSPAGGGKHRGQRIQGGS
jgi:hypothetical protein